MFRALLAPITAVLILPQPRTPRSPAPDADPCTVAGARSAYGIYTVPVSGGHSTRIFDTGLVSFDSFEFEPIKLSWQPVVGS